MTETHAGAERRTPSPRRNFTLIAYLTFTSRGEHKSEENRLYAQETSRRLHRLLDHLRHRVDGVLDVRLFKHALGGLNPVGRGHPPTQVLVEVARLAVLDAMRSGTEQPGELRDLLELVRERIDTCSTEIVYESPLPV
jgi:hypothetical protein